MNAFKKLFNSSKFIFCMIIFIPSTIALFLHRLDGGSYQAIVQTIAGVFLAAHSIVDIVSQKLGSGLPPKGQL